MKLSFKGGVHPLSGMHHGKYLTDTKPIEVMTAPKRVVLAMAQHIGAPAKPIVHVGDRVLKGQKIAEPGGFVSVPIHSSCSGKVTDIAPMPNVSGRNVLSVVIENDFQEETINGYGEDRDIEGLDAKALTAMIQEAGIVGMGGATFPTHVKLSPPPEKSIDTLIVNGAECEPFLTADHRALLEYTDQLIEGLKICMRILGVKKGIIGIENNKKDAIKKVREACENEPIDVQVLKVKYPQGGEKQLIQAITKREVPSGGLPMDIGVVVMNVTTCIAIYQALKKNIPVIERVVTVSGSVKEPKNLKVKLGTGFQEIFEYCGGFTEKIDKVLVGGPMMGLAQYTLEVDVIKGTNGLLALGESLAKTPPQVNCIRCARCVDVCPAGLVPLMMNAYAIRGDYENAQKLNVMDCIECGACSYICPSKRYLTESFKLAKMQINKKKKAQAGK